MDTTPGYTLAKPVVTQAQCDAYTAMATAVTAHNAACAVGDTLWNIEDRADCYAVTEGEAVREPTAEELAAQEEERKKAEERAKLPERVDALETANDDIILMMADFIGG